MLNIMGLEMRWHLKDETATFWLQCSRYVQSGDGEDNMPFEIEFFPVGDASKAGDAMTVRYSDGQQYRILVIDGGTDETGEKIVAHIRKTYGSDAIVSDVICTHPDSDHACGLRAVLHDLKVERLWIHGLWYHASEILELFSGAWTVQGLAAAIKKEYPVVDELLTLAAQQNTPVYEPFAGDKIGAFTVLSPTKAVYQHLIPQFRKTPDPNTDLLKARQIWLSAPKSTLGQLVSDVIAKAADWIAEHWDVELLKEGGVTAAENESSTVLYGDFGDGKILLTADAGVNALTWSMSKATNLGIDLGGVELIQVPHHGSRRNVSPSVLDQLLGPKQNGQFVQKRNGIVSVPKDDEKHPRKMVLNAFRRRGVTVFKTQGQKFRYHTSMPTRENEVSAIPFDFFDKVEAYD